MISVNENLQITDFHEKPDEPTALPDNPGKYQISMVLYVFSSQLLKEVLQTDQQNPNSTHNFGQDILPSLLNDYAIKAYKFGSEDGRVTPDRYWRDIVILDSYYEANIDLLKPVPPLNLYQKN